MTIAGVGLILLGVAALTGRKHLVPVGLAIAGMALVVGWGTALAAVLAAFGA
ncbi:hypothetical protein [Streptacidiphilus sp. PAMC 29251]